LSKELSVEVPKYHDLMNPTLQALRNLGGSASNQELAEEVIQLLKLPSEVTEIPNKSTNETLLEYRLAWARTYLKKVGLVTNSERAVWALTPEGREVTTVDPQEVQREVRRQMKKSDNIPQPIEDEEPEDLEDDLGHMPWQQHLLSVLRSMKPDAFERLCQRLLREAGFIQVEVTGRAGDGGIDGHGIVKIARLLSFPAIFQAKRYQGSVGANEIRNFRGAMMGRAEKGLFITTGSFTPSAYAEATRDGPPPIDLVDGEQLVQMLKELQLGVTTRVVEAVEVDEEWFRGI
jgi:restriction system protein